MRSRPPVVLAAAVLAAVLTACGEEPVPEELEAVPVQSVVPMDAGDTTDEPRATVPETAEGAGSAEGEPAATAAPSEAGVDEPEEDLPEDRTEDRGSVHDIAADPGDPPAETGPSGPTDADLARFVAARTRNALSSDHRVTDLDGDGVRDVVVGLLALDRHLELITGAWDGTEVVETGRVGYDGATDLGVIVVRDVIGDGRPEVVAPFRDRPHHGALLVQVTRSGALALPDACPVPGARRQVLDFGGGPEAVDLVCDRRETQGNQGLAWSDGVFVGAAAIGAQARSGGN